MKPGSQKISIDASNRLKQHDEFKNYTCNNSVSLQPLWAANTNETTCRDPVTTIMPDWIPVFSPRIWFATFNETINELSAAKMVPFSNLYTCLDFAGPLWIISMPSSSEAWIQQSLNKEAEVVRDLPPAMWASVRKTASRCPPDEM